MLNVGIFLFINFFSQDCPGLGKELGSSDCLFFLSRIQRLRPLGHCAHPSKMMVLAVICWSAPSDLNYMFDNFLQIFCKYLFIFATFAKRSNSFFCFGLPLSGTFLNVLQCLKPMCWVRWSMVGWHLGPRFKMDGILGPILFKTALGPRGWPAWFNRVQALLVGQVGDELWKLELESRGWVAIYDEAAKGCLLIFLKREGIKRQRIGQPL